MKLMSADEILNELEIIYEKMQGLNDYTMFHALMDIDALLKQNKR